MFQLSDFLISYYHFRSVKIIFIALVSLTIANAFDLQCNFIIRKELYSCTARNLSINEPHTKISSVSGNHLPNLTNSDVQNLEINKKNVIFLPINIAEYFPNLKRLAVKFSKLKFITPSDFLGLTQLHTIYLAENAIKELPCGVFDTNQRLQEIHMENNNLKSIGADIFEPLPHLKVVHFRQNSCINRDVNTTSEVPALLNAIKEKCVVSCDQSLSYPAPASSCDSKFYKKIINEMGNTIYNLDFNYNATIFQKSNLINEKDELSVKLINLESMNVEYLNEIANLKVKVTTLENDLKYISRNKT